MTDIADEIGYLDASLRAEGSLTEHKFWVQSIDDGVGRRIAKREFMGRDEPGTSDLGRAGREHRSPQRSRPRSRPSPGTDRRAGKWWGSPGPPSDGRCWSCPWEVLAGRSIVISCSASGRT